MFIYNPMEKNNTQNSEPTISDEQKKAEARKAGRPPSVIDWDKVAAYLKAQCSTTSIAAILGISTDTLYLRCKEDLFMDYTAFAQEKKGEGKELLRAKQYTDAMSGNVTLQIWLGKQYLDQKDKQELDIKNNANDIDNMTKEQLQEKLANLKKQRNGIAR